MASKSEQLINEIGQLTVLELAELVKALEEKFDVSAAMPTAAMAPAAAAGEPEAAKEEKTEYKVELVQGGPEKMKTIKALRQVTTLGLIDAKKAVEAAPTVIAETAPKEEAQKMKEVLEGAGAQVKLS